MKSVFQSFQIFLLLCGVFGAEVKSVSVMEGDSVTLNPDLTEIRKFNLIEWSFGDPVIAQTDGNDISYPSHTDLFRDRLQLDQTGSLTIKNMRNKHSGLYQLQISHKDGTSDQKFSVTVYESRSSDAGEAEMKSFSLTEGAPVTLQTDVTELHGDELIVWRFGDEEKLIAKADIESKSSPVYYDERFRDRLQLDQTGSLSITNTRTTDSGHYSVKISSNKQTNNLYKRFTVTVSAVPASGVSSGAVAGIVIGLLVAVAVAVAGLMYYLRPRTTNLPNQMWSVLPGDNVPLNPETEIQSGDEIQWLFGAEDTLIAEINREMKTHDDAAGGIFNNRLKLDETGSLTITEFRAVHTGLYTLKIRRGRETLYQRFTVSVRQRKKTVTEGGSVTLQPDAGIQTGDELQWRFGDEDTLIAEIKNTEVTPYEGPGGRFRDRLKLNKETGSLTITEFRAVHTGRYTVKTRRDAGIIHTRFYIYNIARPITVTEGEPVTLQPATEIHKDDSIQWVFIDKGKQTVIAEIRGETREIIKHDDVLDGRFRDRLDLDQTGSLTITNTRNTHSGRYKLLIISSSRRVSEQKFIVTVNDKVEKKPVKVGESVTLDSDPEIQRDDQILWTFGVQDHLIAQIRGGTRETYHDGVNERFRGKLKLNETGSLTITNITSLHAGPYKLQIISSREIETLCKKFRVLMDWKRRTVTEGDPVTLKTGFTGMQRDDEIQWRFGDKETLIAEIKRGTGEPYYVPDERFRDRLKLNNQTGSLTILNSTAEHEGLYKVQISSSKGKTSRIYIVIISGAAVKDETRKKSLMNEQNVSTGKRENESATVMMPLLNGDGLEVVNEEEGTSSL